MLVSCYSTTRTILHRLTYMNLLWWFTGFPTNNHLLKEESYLVRYLDHLYLPFWSLLLDRKWMEGTTCLSVDRAWVHGKAALGWIIAEWTCLYKDGCRQTLHLPFLTLTQFCTRPSPFRDILLTKPFFWIQAYTPKQEGTLRINKVAYLQMWLMQPIWIICLWTRKTPSFLYQKRVWQGFWIHWETGQGIYWQIGTLF